MGRSLYILALPAQYRTMRTKAYDRCAKRWADEHGQEQHQGKKAIRTGQSST